MKYKVGDKVRVRTDLVDDDCTKYGGAYARKTMVDLCGQVVTITTVFNNHGIKYTVKEDKGNWNWTDEMFTGLATETNNEPIELKGKQNFTIKSYKTLNDRVLIVEFADGDIQRSVCDEHDTFDFERGLEICVMKHICGKPEYHKAIRVATQQVEELDFAEKQAQEKAERIAKKKAKFNAYKAKRAEKRAEREREEKEIQRAERVGEMAEAFSLALKENGGNVNEVSEGVLRKIINTFKGDK